MPSLDGGEPCKPRVAGLLAVHLVSQILDEAYVIANAAEDSGQPWRYLTMLKNIRRGNLDDVEEDMSFVASKGDSDNVNENKVEAVANIVATSTPQKVAGNDGSSKSKTEPTLIGQGDEEFDTAQNELSKSTSMFINHLFDMSEVERVICDDTEILESNPVPDNMLTRAMMTIMESYVNTAFNIAFEQEPQDGQKPAEKSPRSTEHSCFAFLTDAFGGGIGEDIAFCINDDVDSNIDNNYEILEVAEEIPSITQEIDIHDDVIEENIQRNDVTFYENAYLTLNRDYDQCSDDDGDPVLQDPKGMTLQEVELISADSSEENLSAHPEPEQEARKELAAISAVSGASGSRKSKTSLISRCRSQGARLLSCLRGWWRRKTPGKRREARPHGSIRGMCPLSPDARRRASSLLDQRNLYSPTPSRSIVWKFNTVNETLVNSSRWKEYTFEMKPEECGEY